MNKPLLVAASFALLTIAPCLSFADEIVVEPEVQTWVMDQSASGVEVDGDVVIGGTLPEAVQVIEIPKYRKYNLAVVNKRRVLIEPKTRKIIKIYE